MVTTYFIYEIKTFRSHYFDMTLLSMPMHLRNEVRHDRHTNMTLIVFRMKNSPFVMHVTDVSDTSHRGSITLCTCRYFLTIVKCICIYNKLYTLLVHEHWMVYTMINPSFGGLCRYFYNLIIIGHTTITNDSIGKIIEAQFRQWFKKTCVHAYY